MAVLHGASTSCELLPLLLLLKLTHEAMLLSEDLLQANPVQHPVNMHLAHIYPVACVT